ncbi:putative Sin3 binding protein-domain-containing protein [Tuber indicum]|nr:putative Sin3 binding protein-domain-containing protein [Tuber indicum]
MATITTTTATSMSVAIPTSRLHRGGKATVSDNNAFTLPEPYSHFPTPPNSISPSLPPVPNPVTASADSDIDVPDIITTTSTTPVHHQLKAAPGTSLLAETTGAITPSLLAKYHLPEILLKHGPLAIRHLTAHLISAIPGFSSIPPAKQRRLVVGALEGRGGVSGSEGEAGGVNGDVVFDKVGWGRWDARVKSDPPRSHRGISPATSDHSSFVKTKAGIVGRSYTGESGIFVQSEEEGGESMDSEGVEGEEEEEDGVDRMSLDESSSSEDEEDEDDGDITDEEDWAQMGAAMLRNQVGSPISPTGGGFDNLSTAWGASVRAREEREAVEALVKLSSV